MKSYLERRRDLKNGIGVKNEKEAKEEKSNLGTFFKKMIANSPGKCEECKKNLAGTMAVNPAAIVAHILPKRKTGGVPSMATNPANIVFLCGDHHTNYDKKGCDYIVKMKIYHVLRHRVAIMWPHIPEDEKRHVPECLTPAYAVEEPETVLK